MKPGMQRDILIAFRLLFDEFVLDDEDELADAVKAVKAAQQKAPPDDKSK